MDGDLGPLCAGSCQANIVAFEKIGTMASGRPPPRPAHQRTGDYKASKPCAGFALWTRCSRRLTRPCFDHFNEVYSALQTKIVGRPGKSAGIVSTAKLYEVQKYAR